MAALKKIVFFWILPKRGGRGRGSTGINFFLRFFFFPGYFNAFLDIWGGTCCSCHGRDNHLEGDDHGRDEYLDVDYKGWYKHLELGGQGRDDNLKVDCHGSEKN